MLIYIVDLWDKNEQTLINQWIYDNCDAAQKRADFEAAKYDSMTRLYNGGYEEYPNDDNMGIRISISSTTLRSVFEEKGA